MANRKVGDQVPFTSQISKQYALKRLQELLQQVPAIRVEGHNSPHLSPWVNDVKAVLAQLYGAESYLFKQFDKIWFCSAVTYPGQPEEEHEPYFMAGLNEAEGILKSRISDLRHQLGNAADGNSQRRKTASQSSSRKIFVVHGHDHGTKETVARFLGKLDLEPIILHEQPDQGNTIIEKFEVHAEDVGCAVVILTADDIAASKKEPNKKENRARQNVILELGFFVGKLGRDHTFALVEKEVALPSDIHGLVYIPLDDGTWGMRLVKELKAAGLEVDANKAF